MSSAALSAWCTAHESHPFGLVCEAGGNIHLKLNICLKLIANKYLEGKVKQDFEKRARHA